MLLAGSRVEIKRLTRFAAAAAASGGLNCFGCILSCGSDGGASEAQVTSSVRETGGLRGRDGLGGDGGPY